MNIHVIMCNILAFQTYCPLVHNEHLEQSTFTFKSSTKKCREHFQYGALWIDARPHPVSGWTGQNICWMAKTNSLPEQQHCILSSLTTGVSTHKHPDFSLTFHHGIVFFKNRKNIYTHKSFLIGCREPVVQPLNLKLNAKQVLTSPIKDVLFIIVYCRVDFSVQVTELNWTVLSCEY